MAFMETEILLKVRCETRIVRRMEFRMLLKKFICYIALVNWPDSSMIAANYAAVVKTDGGGQRCRFARK